MVLGVVNCLQHDSLLAHQEDEILDEDERAEAWVEYEKKASLFCLTSSYIMFLIIVPSTKATACKESRANATNSQ